MFKYLICYIYIKLFIISYYKIQNYNINEYFLQYSTKAKAVLQKTVCLAFNITFIYTCSKIEFYDL